MQGSSFASSLPDYPILFLRSGLSNPCPLLLYPFPQSVSLIRPPSGFAFVRSQVRLAVFPFARTSSAHPGYGIKTVNRIGTTSRVKSPLTKNSPGLVIIGRRQLGMLVSSRSMANTGCPKKHLETLPFLSAALSFDRRRRTC